MRTFKLTLAYDGTNFSGWQSQGDQRTVQSVLEQKLAKIVGHDRVCAMASGRTDAGVHALGQVVGVALDWEHSAKTLQQALASELPHDVVVVDAEEVGPDFDATRSAIGKRYRYRIFDDHTADVFLRRTTWHCFTRLDDAAMQQATALLAGKHDFSSFEATGSPRRSSVRTITDIGVTRGADDERVVSVDVAADGCLYKMVRTIVGSLVEVGRGAREVSWMADVLAAHDRHAAGPTAPPQGLFLVEVYY